ncbi:MAG: SAM-dependent methyltransferase [Xanthomonadales bacterium]|nr:SAM-dependent methyltransferase [Xanthomonadales bacterium]
MPRYRGPLLVQSAACALLAARESGAAEWTGSLDLGRSTGTASLHRDGWQWHDAIYPWPAPVKERDIAYWDGTSFATIARYSGHLIKLVPTAWGAPTFEIDGIKMLPTATASPLDDARRKVALVMPRNGRVLDTCGGLGYFAACCLEAGAAQVLSFEKDADVLWLRTLNPWSPDPANCGGRLDLEHADVTAAIASIADASVDALLHDPPRFGIAGELYSLAFYRELARVLRRGGRLFHYTGSPNRRSRGRDLPREVVRRLEQAGFAAAPALDGVLARRR